MNPDLKFLAAEGMMADLTANFDWAGTTLGPISKWPQSLRTSVSLILNSKFPTYMVWGPSLISFYNDAYRPVLGNKPEALGRPFAEVWAEAWPVIGPIATRALNGEASYFENLPLTLERKGYPEQTWWTFSYSPIRDESGGVGGILCTVHETTGEVLARAELRAQREHLADLFRQAPGFICVVSGPEHRFELANDSYLELIGGRDVVGRTVLEALPEVADQGFIQLLDSVFRSGQPFIGSGVEVELARKGGLSRLFVDFVYQPIKDEAGQVTGIFVEGMNVTERMLAAERQRLLVNELNHRVKNSLATVQSIVAQSLRSAANLSEAYSTVEQRIISLARAHDVLTQESWSGADLDQVVSRAVQPFMVPEKPRIRYSGSHVRVLPAQALSLSLSFHELATNAAKYGALSGEAGSVEIEWRRRREGADEIITITWTERGGPPVTAPNRTGFGTRLIQRGLAAELNGAVRFQYEREGVQCQIEFPLARDEIAPIVGGGRRAPANAGARHG